jgi:8-oxo-dGTP pyrophosphatase MutT (NUDIX family)
MANKKNNWKTISSKQGPDLILFKTRFDRVKNPRNSHILDAVILEAPDWVNVVALTPQNKIIVVRQHRFGINKETVEIPAGLVDKNETSHQAAIRELREETGYTTKEWKYLGYVEPNPAFMDNLCFTWLAHNVVKTNEQKFDKGENIVVSALSEIELRKEIKEERMRNSLALIALSYIFDLRNIMHMSPR